jgi:hypothetical protein
MKLAINIANPYLAASQHSTPIDQLSWLVFHEDMRVRRRLADNPKLPVAFLADLANDEHPEVRIAVAENPRTPISIVELLAEDNHADVRHAIAENHNMPIHVLHLLANDENPYVSARAYVTIKRLEGEQVTTLRCCA